jgi:hypothetical protein
MLLRRTPVVWIVLVIQRTDARNNRMVSSPPCPIYRVLLCLCRMKDRLRAIFRVLFNYARVEAEAATKQRLRGLVAMFCSAYPLNETNNGLGNGTELVVARRRAQPEEAVDHAFRD